MAVLRAGGGFGVILHAECWLVAKFEAAIAAVEQADVRRRCVRGQGRGVYCKAVVHARDLDRTVAQALYRMVCAAVALMHLFRTRPYGQPEHLVAEADAEQRLFGLQPLLDDRHGVFSRRGRVTGTVREERAIRRMSHDVFKTGGGGDDLDLAAGIDQVAEDVVFDAVVDGYYFAPLKPHPFRGGVGVGAVSRG